MYVTYITLNAESHNNKECKYPAVGSVSFFSHLFFFSIGQEDEKGKVMGIFRSMGALARALGPVVACSGEADLCSGFLHVSSLPPPTTQCSGAMVPAFVT